MMGFSNTTGIDQPCFNRIILNLGDGFPSIF